MVKKVGESWGLLATSVATFLSSHLPFSFLSAMSPSSVRDDGIKGDSRDLLHLGPNVGKPVRRYGFALLLFIAAQLTFIRPRYYQEIQRCTDFFYELVL